MTRDQKKSDREVEQVRARRDRDRKRIDEGQITNPKDLERMTHEMVSLERRISDLEDVELEIMARLEDAQSDLTAAESDLTDLDEQIAATTAERDRRGGALQGELTETEAKRVAAIASIPAELLRLYDKVRERQGTGAAMLRARRCEGCQITLDAGTLGQITKAAADEVVRCEECSRILVRTDESGLIGRS
ncbi:zinc ribbon domain-containing protein [Nocardioides alcanivorans]|uniref:zinc ribbon domain-containing protein n=1 Tax=Nocardioides alcanivorans TaxID=2897352 RepID=UPI0040678BEB